MRTLRLRTLSICTRSSLPTQHILAGSSAFSSSGPAMCSTWSPVPRPFVAHALRHRRGRAGGWRRESVGQRESEGEQSERAHGREGAAEKATPT